MFEYEIVQITRNKEKKTREVTNKKGKSEIEAYIEVEILADFYSRAKRILNDFASEGWQALSVNYSLPIEGHLSYGGIGASTAFSYTATDFDSAEFVFVLQRSK